MTVTISCCLTLPPKITDSDQSPSDKKGTRFSWPRNENWRKRCVLGMACMIIGLQAGDSFDDSTGGIATARETPYAVEGKERNKVARWSEKRMCPPWRANSLETIVPENLPRPSARRRWEAVGHTKNAPPVKVTVETNANAGCFSM